MRSSPPEQSRHCAKCSRHLGWISRLSINIKIAKKKELFTHRIWETELGLKGNWLMWIVKNSRARKGTTSRCAEEESRRAMGGLRRSFEHKKLMLPWLYWIKLLWYILRSEDEGGGQEFKLLSVPLQADFILIQRKHSIHANMLTLMKTNSSWKRFKALRISVLCDTRRSTR